MRIWLQWLALMIVAVGIGLAPALSAAEPQPAVGPGASREDVLKAYGWPTGQSKRGGREILSYPQGQVTLENGRVERMDFSAKLPWPAPRPRPAAPSPTSVKKEKAVKKVDAPVDLWIDDFDRAVREATGRGGHILALFTGRDWSPASQLFHEQVATHPDFINAFATDYVFLRLDFPTRTSLTTKLREQNDRLRARYGVTVYPTLLVLSPEGENLAAVDLAGPHAGDSFRARAITAIQAEHDRLGAQAAATAAFAAANGGAGAAAMGATTLTPLAQRVGFSTGESLLIAALVLVAIVAALLCWLLWRTSTPKKLPRAALAVRISNAASGVPDEEEIAVWSKEKVCVVVAALAESEGYLAELMPLGNDKDLVLRDRGETQPRVAVCCVPGGAGVVAGKRLRELVATLAADGTQTGWFVSPRGFAHDAHAYAEQHKIVLIDGARMVERLRELPPLLLTKVLPRAQPREG